MTNTQKSVAISMALGLLISIVSMYLSKFIHIEELTLEGRLMLLAKALIAPAIFIFFCVANIASHRFNSKIDIDASIGQVDSFICIEKQRVLQNTLEQSVLASITYIIWTIIAPENWLGLLVVNPLLFAIGRILFILFHKNGAKGRAIGFVLTFYPTVLLLLIEVVLLFFKR